MKDKYLTLKEAAEILRIRPATLAQWARDRKITHYRSGKKVLFTEADLEKFLARSRIGKAG